MTPCETQANHEAWVRTLDAGGYAHAGAVHPTCPPLSKSRPHVGWIALGIVLVIAVVIVVYRRVSVTQG
jgi:hypothetical protein